MKTINTARQIGQVVRSKRTSLNLTQQELAEAAGVSRGFINRIEKGASAAVYPAKLLDVLRALGLALVIEDQNEKPQSAENPTDQITPTTPPPRTRREYQLDPALLKPRNLKSQKE